MTPVFGHGELRLYLLSLVSEAPRHGYDIIRALSDRFGGTYQPSPGTVYPRLARLEEEGLVTREDQGRKSIYRITDAGRSELAARDGELAALESDIESTVRDRAESVRSDVRSSMAGLRADLAAAAQQARAQAREDTRTGRVEDWAQEMPEGKAAKIRLRETELLLDAFRGSVRAQLKVKAHADEGISPLTLDTVRAVLAQAETSIRETLR